MPNNKNLALEVQSPRDKIQKQLKRLLTGDSIDIISFLKYRYNHAEVFSNNELLDLLVADEENIDVWNINQLLYLTVQIPELVYISHSLFNKTLQEKISKGSAHACILFCAYMQFAIGDISYNDQDETSINMLIKSLESDPENQLFQYFKMVYLYLDPRKNIDNSQHMNAIHAFCNEQNPAYPFASLHYYLFQKNVIKCDKSKLDSHLLQNNRHPLASLALAKLTVSESEANAYLKFAVDCGSIDGLYNYKNRLAADENGTRLTIIKKLAALGDDETQKWIITNSLLNPIFLNNRDEPFKYLIDLMHDCPAFVIQYLGLFIAHAPQIWSNSEIQSLIHKSITLISELDDFCGYTIDALYDIANGFITIVEVAKSILEDEIKEKTLKALEKIAAYLENNRKCFVVNNKSQAYFYAKYWLSYHFSKRDDDKNLAFEELEKLAENENCLSACGFVGEYYFSKGDIINAFQFLAKTIDSTILFDKSRLFKLLVDMLIENYPVNLSEHDINLLLKNTLKKNDAVNIKIAFYIYAYCKNNNITAKIDFAKIKHFILSVNNNEQYSLNMLYQILHNLYNASDKNFRAWLNRQNVKDFMIVAYPTFLSIAAYDDCKLRIFYEEMGGELKDKFLMELLDNEIKKEFHDAIYEYYFFFFCLSRFPKLIPILIKQGNYPKDITLTQETISIYDITFLRQENELNIKSYLKALFNDGVLLSENDKNMLNAKTNKKRFSPEFLPLLKAIILGDFIRKKISQLARDITIIENKNTFTLQINNINISDKTELPPGINLDNAKIVIDPIIIQPTKVGLNSLQTLFNPINGQSKKTTKKKRKKKKVNAANIADTPPASESSEETEMKREEPIQTQEDDEIVQAFEATLRAAWETASKTKTPFFNALTNDISKTNTKNTPGNLGLKH